MKSKLLGVITAAVVLSIAYSGCGVVENKPGSDTKVGSATRSLAPAETTLIFAARPKKKVTVDVDNGACTATFEEQPNGALKKGTLTVANGTGQCTAEETDGPESLIINGNRVIDISPAQFTTEGSCRYCYINSTGGMSCINYNRTPCPR
jgi:hypothetical protein